VKEACDDLHKEAQLFEMIIISASTMKGSAQRAIHAKAAV
jgi:hypothetical protein